MSTLTVKRAAIYARYSTDMQSSASIVDQVRLCRRLCADNGWTVVEVFADEAMSGASHLRPQFQAMQQLAMQGGFDVLVAEALDRLSRDQEHIAGLHKRMRYLGVDIVTKAEGEISEMHIGLGGTMSALFLRQLVQKTHRGLEGRVKAGKSAGGLSYGYRLDRQPLPDGSYTTGDRVIDATEAAVIGRIFSDYDRGKGEGTWSFSTISGNWKRGTGILNNELYIGRLVWNRQRFVKAPETGKRQARPNPPEAWVIEEVPDLRIIDEALWQRVKARQGAIRTDIFEARDAETLATNAFGVGRRPTYLFSGLLKCGCCGAGYTLMNKVKYGCSAARNRGTCENRKLIHREEVEERVLAGLRDKLMHPELLAAFIAEFQREVQKERLGALAARGEAERRLAKVVREIDNIVSAITAGMFHPSMKAKMDGLEAERTALEAQLSALPEPEPVALHPGLAGIYAQKVSALAEALNDDRTRSEATEILRGLVSEIRLHPEAHAPGGHRIELYGELGAILALGEAGNDKPRLLAGVLSDSMVAGAGFGLWRTRHPL